MASYQGVSSYQGYDPEREKLERRRSIAESLQQGAFDSSPKSFGEGIAQLGKALIARQSMGKLNTAETAYSDKMKNMADMVINQMAPGDASMAAYPASAPPPAAPVDPMSNLPPAPTGQLAPLRPGVRPDAGAVDGSSADLNMDGLLADVKKDPAFQSPAPAPGFTGYTPDQMASADRNAKLKALLPMLGLQGVMQYDQQEQAAALAADDRKYGRGRDVVADAAAAAARATQESQWKALFERAENAPPEVNTFGQTWDKKTGKYVTVPGALENYDRMHPQSSSASTAAYRPATAEDLKRWNIPEGVSVKINTLTNEPEVISGARAPSLYTPVEQKTFRNKAAALKTLGHLTSEYKSLVDQYGPGLFDSNAKGEKTIEGQLLRAAHNNLMMYLKGPEMFNLGVLTGPDLERLQRTIPEPVGLGAFGQSKETLNVGIKGLDDLVNFQMDQIPEEYRNLPGQSEQPGQPNMLDQIGGAVGGFMQNIMGGNRQAPQPGQPPQPQAQPNPAVAHLSDQEIEAEIKRRGGR